MKLTYRTLWVFAGAILLASCATAPKPTPKPPAPVATKPATPTPTPTKPQVPAPNSELQQAQALKAQIDKYGLNSQDPATYAKGVADLNAGQSAMGTDNANAKTRLDASISEFKSVVATAFPRLIQEREQQVAQARTDALAVKADKAVPATYNQAVTDEKQGEAKKSAGAYASAYDLLGSALGEYKQAADLAKQKRAAAEAALKSAEDQLSQTRSQVDEIQKNLKSERSATAAQSAAGGQ